MTNGDQADRERQTATRTEIPFDGVGADALARTDLDAAFPDFADGSPIVWIGVYELAQPGPAPNPGWGGKDWMIGFPESFDAPVLAGAKEPLRASGAPLAAVQVETHATTVSGARDIGRNRVRALVGYMHLRTDLFTGSRLVWEGPAIIRLDGTLLVGAGATRYELRVSDAGLIKSRDATAEMALGSLEPKHELALEWLAEARTSDTLPIRLVNLWFAVVVVVDSGYSSERFGHASDATRTQMEHLRITSPCFRSLQRGARPCSRRSGRHIASAIA